MRLPIGLMFAIYGALLAGYGLVSTDEIYQRSLGVNVNLQWGSVLLGFGLVLLWFGFRAGGKKRG